MGEIVNLRREKKRRVRELDAQAAAENRVRFGRGAVAKANDQAMLTRTERVVADARLADNVVKKDRND